MEKTKEQLRYMLSSGAVSVSFTKKDGSDRTMLCTTDPSLIPSFQLPKTESLREADSESDNMKVFDLEAQGWRSFNYSTLKD